MHQTARELIGKRVVSHAAVPLLRGTLAYHHRYGAQPGTVHPPVVQDQPGQLLPVNTVCQTVRQLIRQPTHAPVLHAVTLLAGVVAQCAAHAGFTAAAGAGHQQILVSEPHYLWLGIAIRELSSFLAGG